jgi:hypothetical protein
LHLLFLNQNGFESTLTHSLASRTASDRAGSATQFESKRVARLETRSNDISLAQNDLLCLPYRLDEIEPSDDDANDLRLTELLARKELNGRCELGHPAVGACFGVCAHFLLSSLVHLG